MVSIDDIRWLAGWLEGEGSFTARATTHLPVICASGTDRDVMERAGRLLGATIRGPIKYKDKPHYKPCWRLALHGSNAAGWMMSLYSLMGMRRKEQIGIALKAWRVLGTTPHSRARLRNKFPGEANAR